MQQKINPRDRDDSEQAANDRSKTHDSQRRNEQLESDRSERGSFDANVQDRDPESSARYTRDDYDQNQGSYRSGMQLRDGGAADENAQISSTSEQPTDAKSPNAALTNGEQRRGNTNK